MAALIRVPVERTMTSATTNNRRQTSCALTRTCHAVPLIAAMVMPATPIAYPIGIPAMLRCHGAIRVSPPVRTRWGPANKNTSARRIKPIDRKNLPSLDWLSTSRKLTVTVTVIVAATRDALTLEKDMGSASIYHTPAVGTEFRSGRNYPSAFGTLLHHALAAVGTEAYARRHRRSTLSALSWQADIAGRAG